MTTYTCLDVETAMQWLDSGKKDGSPFHELNQLVSVGYNSFNDKYQEEDYLFFHHAELVHNPKELEQQRKKLQQVLDHTDVLIGHFVKFDLLWLKEAGFKYDGEVFCTGISEYILARGQKRGLSLEDCCIRRKVALKKSKLIANYIAKGIGFDKMPIGIVEEYGRGDVQSALELYHELIRIYNEPKNIGLIPTRDMMNEFLVVLTSIEQNGIAVDLAMLDKIEQEYLIEQKQLRVDIDKIVAEVMGDTPVNLASPEQLSQVIYSRKVKDKHKWQALFNIGLDERGKAKKRPYMSPQELKNAIRENTQVLARTVASQCSSCGGSGKIEKYTKAGDLYKNLPNCTACSGVGIKYSNTTVMAGLGLGPRSINDLSSGGFATDKEMLLYLSKQPNIKDIARKFLTKMVRLNAVETYLSSFVGGIRRATRQNGILHPTFNQCITSTGRLSSSDPNFQNQPRGTTFPVKRCIVSRWSGGLIGEVDFAQLEFRGAQELSKCLVMLADILDPGFDAHRYTSKVLTDAGQPTNRQDSKPHTFKPLYGGTSGTDAERTYYKAFMDKYEGLQKWHEELLSTAVSHKPVTLPSGREFVFPAAERTRTGWVIGSTAIKNYPVQAFATADIVPIACIRLYYLMKEANLKSLIINTVHDSMIVDIYPGEKDQVISLMIEACKSVKEECKRRYNYVLTCPLGVEIKAGQNWLDMKEVEKINYFEYKEAA